MQLGNENWRTMNDFEILIKTHVDSPCSWTYGRVYGSPVNRRRRCGLFGSNRKIANACFDSRCGSVSLEKDS